MAIAQLCTEGDVLVRHVIVGSGGVVCRVRIARVLCEVGCSARSRRSVDGRQQSKVATGIAHLPAAQSERVLVLSPPHAVVEHVANEVLLVRGPSTGRCGCRFIAVAAYVRACIDGIGSYAHFATGIGRKGKCSLVDVVGLVVVVLYLDTVVRVKTMAVWDPRSIFSQAVVVEDQVEPWPGAP